MIIDRFRNLVCPNCGQDCEIDVISIQTFICTCNKCLKVTEDEIDGSLRYLLEVVPEEELYKRKLSKKEMKELKINDHVIKYI